MTMAKIIIRSKETYSWLKCCEMFKRRNHLNTFSYLRYTRKANFVMGPATHRQKRDTKYYISGADLYRLIRDRKPKFIFLINFKDE